MQTGWSWSFPVWVTRNSRDALLKKLMERRNMAADQIDTNCAAAPFQRMDGFRSRNSETPTLQHRANVTEMPLMYGGELSTHHVLVDAGLELPSIVLKECLGKVLRGARHAGEVCDHFSLLLGKIPHCTRCPRCLAPLRYFKLPPSPSKEHDAGKFKVFPQPTSSGCDGDSSTWVAIPFRMRRRSAVAGTLSHSRGTPGGMTMKAKKQKSRQV